ncbi:MAG: polysaccharide deacetylase family protein [Candidatus Daviesbacteria bacterium]|nr:polysaccharide deacetylase family protein [Candidatus Daviesbacteria bacterium]
MGKKKTPSLKTNISPILIILSIILIVLVFLLYSQSNLMSIKLPKNMLVNQKNQTIPNNKLKPTATPTQKPEEKIYTPQISGNQLRVPILFYHYIGNNPNPADLVRNNLSVSPDKFDEQMRYLKENGYNSISLDTLYPSLRGQTTLPSKPVVLTFDDGYIDFYTNAYPILLKYGLHATVFIPTNLMNQGYYLSWNQIREMSGSGLIHFGAHGLNHWHLTSLPSLLAESEIVQSKKILQDILGIPINFIAYPYGSVNENVINITKKAGYMGALGTWANKIQSEGTIYDMPRLRVGGGASLETFIGLL